MDDDHHPLLVELSSLRETAARFQHEAHAAAIKLQRHSLDASRIHEHAAALEQENARLAHEVDVLRAHQDPPHHPAVAQVQELSLALRRVSDKIALTEDTLLERTSELAHVHNELARAKHTVDGAYELAARMRSREEAAKARERELEFKARASEEERRMVDLVVQEYADLVRNLEGRKSVNHTPPVSNGFAASLTDTLQDGKFNLHKMLTTFSAESESLHATIADLNARVSSLQMTLDSERLAATHDRTLLSQYKTDLDKLHLEDQTATKMVARYMKFSQASTNALQQQIITLKERHASAIATFELQLSIAHSQLASEHTRSARLQDALDELCEDLARESYGRRREVAIRLALLSREEGVAEFLRRWARRARELYGRCYNSAQPNPSEDAVQESFYRVVADAESLLSTLDDGVQFSDGTNTSGAMARIALSKAAVDAMRSELQEELQKRIEAVRKAALSLQNGRSDVEEPVAGDAGSPKGDGVPGQLSTPSNAMPVEIPPLQDETSPVSMVGAPEGFVRDPSVVPAASPVINVTEVQDIALPSLKDSASTSVTSVTLLVEEELKAVQPHSPAVSTLDLREDSQTQEPPAIDAVQIHALPSNLSIHDDAVIPSTSAPDREPSHTDVVPIDASPSDTHISDNQVLAEDDKVIPSPSISILVPALLSPPSPADVSRTLLSELEATKHRYDALQRAFRDCSVALKELKRTLASCSPLPNVQSKFRQHLETALARIDDYTEDARVELEIRVADEELTRRGFEIVLSVPGALAADDCAELETSARTFTDGTDEGVLKALDKFGKKREEVEHDVAVVKRAVHWLAMSEDEDEGEEESKDASGWTTWTAGLLGATNASPARSPTPVETFGAVMTSPRRHGASLRQGQGHDGEGEPLAVLGLRIPMPSGATAAWTELGVGRPVERPRTLSAMYSVGGLRSSVGLGLGGSSSSPARTRVNGLGMGMGMGIASSSIARNDARTSDFGEVE